jgi:hypothetical protein
MKTFLGPNSRSISRFRKKRQRKQVPAAIRQIAHDLLNQLSAINLCSFGLCAAARGIVGSTVTNDLQTLGRAVEDAMLLAERLPQMIVESEALIEPKAPRPFKSPPQANNILWLFPETADSHNHRDTAVKTAKDNSSMDRHISLR